jgi:serine/threonine protein kinase/TPR repeat protein
MLFAARYQITSKIGEGGMGAVYAAHDVLENRACAVKVILPALAADPALRARFSQEAQVALRIAGDNIVKVLDYGVDTATAAPYIVMELLQGQDLESTMRRRHHLTLRETREIMSQLCTALGAAHRANVVHRDLKPENIFLTKPSTAEASFVLKIVDFGIAKIISQGMTAPRMTAALGTLLWMAPEQTYPNANITPAVDVWSVGLIAFHLLTGEYYWTNPGVREISMDPIVLASVRARERGCAERIPPGFDAWFARCLDREPLGRFPTAAEAGKELLPILSPATKPVESMSRVTFSGTSRPPVSKGTFTASALGGLLLLGLSFGVYKLELGKPVVNECASLTSPTRLTACKDACQAKSAKDCSIYGDLLSKSATALADTRAAYSSACDGDDGYGCYRLLRLMIQDDTTDAGQRSATTARAVKLLGPACDAKDAKDAKSCGALGVMSLDGEGLSRDKEKGLSRVASGCDGGTAIFCTRLGVETEDPTKAAEYFHKGCDGGDGLACAQLGDRVRSGRGVAASDADAARLYQKACDLGSGLGCFRLSAGADQDPAKKALLSNARSLLGSACNLNDWFSCEARAAMALNDLGTSNPITSSIYSKFCKLGEPRACTMQGWMRENGLGLPKSKADPGAARETYQQACSDGKSDPSACARLGFLMLEGLGGPINIPEADRLFDLACSKGDALGCYRKGRREGETNRALGEATIAKARPGLALQCADGDAASCAALGWLYFSGWMPESDNVPKAKAEAEGERLIRVGCAHGDISGCISLGAILKTQDRDLETAAGNLILGCKADYSKACIFLLAVYKKSTVDPKLKSYFKDDNLAVVQSAYKTLCSDITAPSWKQNCEGIVVR